MASQRTFSQRVPTLRCGQAAAYGVPIVWLVQEPRRRRRRLITDTAEIASL